MVNVVDGWLVMVRAAVGGEMCGSCWVFRLRSTLVVHSWNYRASLRATCNSKVLIVSYELIAQFVDFGLLDLGSKGLHCA